MKTIISFVLALILFTSAAWAQGVIVVQNWPGDVPCGALKKNPNKGTWTVNKTLVLPGDIRIYGGTCGLAGREVKAWNEKCGAAVGTK
jgi:hypothetical protein